ncbi:MAG: decarboxylating 6-phosphogluconate dehydrogenase [Hyphomicrobiales bacterium]
MQIGMIGLGRMGANMAQRLLTAGHEVHVNDVNAEAVTAMLAKGARGSADLPAFLKGLATPRAVWLMLPAAVVDTVIARLQPLLSPGDIIIDGGNSHFQDDIRRALDLAAAGLHYVDTGVSGGIWGLERGYCLMIGGEKATVTRLDPIFKALAPGIAAAPRTDAADATPSPAEQGYLHCGPAGAGHFVKMVHNGIEYGVMAAFAEGLNVLRHANVGKADHVADAETAPLRHPEFYQYDFDVAEIAEAWRRGSVIGSWLLDLTAKALRGNPDLPDFSGHVADSGEGRWTLQAAIDEGVPTPVIATSLFARFSSRGADDYAERILSALRWQFGGHAEKSAKPETKS